MKNINITTPDYIDNRYLMYAVELLTEIISDMPNEIAWLYSVEEYEKIEQNAQSTIIKLLNIFENIIDVNKISTLKPEKINRLISQLANIIRLSKSLDTKTLSNLKYHLSNLKKETLNPNYIPSNGFSQEGEDLILMRLFPALKTGFFVDVGAHHPIRFSNTYLLYKMGWRGINIDPRPGGMSLFNEIRPDDINLEVAIGDGHKQLQTINYISYKEPAFNSLYIGNKDDIENSVDSEIVDISEVDIRTLDDVLDEYSERFKEINLLSIDVEGFEKQVLNGFSIEKYKPDIIVLEIRGFEIDSRNEIEEYNLIVKNGYKLRSVLYHSLIFKRLN